MTTAPVVHDRGLPGGNTVLATVDDGGIAWVYFNRPEKRNVVSASREIAAGHGQIFEL